MRKKVQLYLLYILEMQNPPHSKTEKREFIVTRLCWPACPQWRKHFCSPLSILSWCESLGLAVSFNEIDRKLARKYITAKWSRRPHTMWQVVEILLRVRWSIFWGQEISYLGCKARSQFCNYCKLTWSWEHRPKPKFGIKDIQVVQTQL